MSIGTFFHAVIARGLRAADVDIPSVLMEVKAQERGWAQDVTDERLLIEAASILLDLREQVFPFLQPTAIEEWAKGAYTAKIDLVSAVTPVVGADGVAVGQEERPCVIDWKAKFGTSKRERSDAQLALYCLSTGAADAGFCEVYRDGRRPHLSMRRFTDYELARWRRYFDAQFSALDSRGPDMVNWKLSDPSNALCSPKWCRHWQYCEGGEGRAPVV